jgi:death-on-curing protein
MEYAQERHSYLNEPIPELHESRYEKVKSCLETPFQTFDGRYLYKGFYSKAAILFYLLCKNHSLVNGNKRMACITFAFFCFLNNYKMHLEPENFYNLAKTVTNSDPDNQEYVLKAIKTAFKATTEKKS